MENCNFEKCFNKDMSHEEALHIYVSLLKNTPEDLWDDLRKAYYEIDDYILRRDCKLVKKYGIMC